MKILKLDTDAVPYGMDVFDNLSQLVTMYGKEFYVQFKGRRVPFVIRRRLFKHDAHTSRRQLKAIYKLSIAYPKTNNMRFPTLNMSIGDDYYIPASGHIDYVHRNDEHDLSGTFIVELAITFLKFLAVKHVSLADVATADDGSKKCKFELAPYLLLKKNTTFYGKWGFKPQLDFYNTSFDDEKAKLKRLCQVVNVLKKIKVKNILALLTKMRSALIQIATKDITKLVTYNVVEDFETGIKSHEDYNDEWDTHSLNEMVGVLEKVIKSLSPHEHTTIHEMAQTCSCLEFQALLHVGSYRLHMSMAIPHILVIGKKTITNKYYTIFQELHAIISLQANVLDLTSKPSKATC